MGLWAGGSGLPFIVFLGLVCLFFSLKNALKNGECSEASDKPEQRLGMKRKNNKKNRNRKKSNTVPLKQVTSPVGMLLLHLFLPWKEKLFRPLEKQVEKGGWWMVML